MTDQHDDEHHDEDDSRSDDVRRLLAEARHHEPVPDDVAARLDEVLAGLVADEPVRRPEPARVAVPIDLDARRRRDRARMLLVAAAAVVAVGVGVSQLDIGGSLGSGDGAQSAGGGSADSDAAPAAESEAEAAAPSREAADELRRDAGDLDLSALLVDDDDFAELAERKVAAYSFEADVPTDPEDTVSGSAVVPGSGSDGEDSATDRGSQPGEQFTATDGLEAATCGAGPYGRGRLLLVRYRRHPAVLAIRPSVGDSTVVDLLRCRTGEVLRSTTVPTP